MATIIIFTGAYSAFSSEEENAKSDRVEMPEAPGGFHWQACPEIQGALLVPEKWHFAKGKSGDSILYYISDETIESRKSAAIFSLKMTPEIQKSYKMKPSEYAVKFREQSSKKLVIENSWDQEAGTLMMFAFQYLGYRGETPTRAVSMLLANDKTGTLYLISFESTEKEWKKLWKIGEVIINNMILDDEI